MHIPENTKEALAMHLDRKEDLLFFLRGLYGTAAADGRRVKTGRRFRERLKRAREEAAVQLFPAKSPETGGADQQKDPDQPL